MVDLLLRFFFGGLIVSAFAIISDLFKPKSFAGLFGAAPSVALASLFLTIHKQGRQVAATEACSMMFGAVALFVYAKTISYLMLRFKPSVVLVSLSGLLLWLGVAVLLWWAIAC